MTERDRRALQFGLSLIVLSWLGLRAGPEALADVRRLDATTRQEADLLQRSTAKVGQLAELADSIAQLEAIAASVPAAILSGPDAPTAFVDLMRRVSDLVRASATLSGFDERAEGTRLGPLQNLSLLARLETDFAGLLQVVTSAEADPALAAEAVTVRAPSDHSGDAAMERLAITLTLSGWFLTGESLALPDTADRP